MAENRELALILKLVADQFQSEMKKSGGVVGELTKFIGDWRTQLTLGATALFAIAKSTANYGDELVKASQRMGTTIAETARLQHAARLSDTDLTSLTTTVGFLSRQMFEASRGSAEAKRNFEALGLSVTNSNGTFKGTTQILLELNDKFRAMPEGPEKTALAVLALGRAGAQALPLLNSNMREAFTEAEKLGLVMDAKSAKAAERFNDELTRLQASIRGVTNTVGNALIPTLTEMITLFRTLGVGTGLGAGLQFVQEQLIRMNVLLKELQANSQFLFGTGKDTLTFGQLRERIAEIEAGGKKQLFELRHPGVLSSETSGGGGAGGGGAIRAPSGTDQEKLGKAKLEIFLAQNRALEIQARLRGEGEDAAIQEAIGRRILVDTQAMLVALEQEQLGRQIVQQTQAQLAIDMAKQTNEMSEQEQLGRQIVQQTQAQLAIEAARATANRTFFDEWADGMRRYVADTKSGFGLGADLARRTAQMMEQSFRTFFFDLMDGKIKTFKDAMRGLLDFVKQIIAQITAQLVTQQILKYAGVALSGLGGGAAAGGNAAVGVAGYSAVSGFAMGGEIVRRFASGGPVLGAGNLDTVPALLTPGEFVLSRRDVQEIRRGAAGGNVNIGITVNAGGGGGRESGAAAAPNFTQLARDLSKLVELKIIEEQRPGGLLAGA